MRLNFFDALDEVLFKMNLQGERQYIIEKYRVDYYISAIHLALEFDENDHNHYDKDSECERQTFIETKLNCRFLRLSDKNTIYENIGIIMDCIMDSINIEIGKKYCCV